MFSFQKLEVYQKSKRFHFNCKQLISTKKESYVRDQLGRASYSIVLNIAEGSGKFSNPDRRNFFVIARGSVFECVAVIDLLKDEGFIDEEKYLFLLSEAEEISKILYAMIKTLS
jgi:four helix bundle protein